MSYSILLRKNETGEERWYIEGGDWNDGAQFRWTEGNESCDCNRASLFEAEDKNYKCSTGKYTALCVKLSDGQRIPLEESK